MNVSTLVQTGQQIVLTIEGHVHHSVIYVGRTKFDRLLHGLVVMHLYVPGGGTHGNIKPIVIGAGHRIRDISPDAPDKENLLWKMNETV